MLDAADAVHKTLGPGLLESVYEPCFYRELQKCGVAYRRQVLVPIIYDSVQLDEHLRLDVIAGEQVICEIKAVEELLPIHQAQLLTYLKLTGTRFGFLINFNVVLIKNGIKCKVL